ncbi:MAG: hypothetical protein AMK75_03780 [Planctomycetes bacterium SM23_65]|nr:MAG: hypothetical protein AMK75_03780 [Planctomycetes bacterium SM23_65]
MLLCCVVLALVLAPSRNGLNGAPVQEKLVGANFSHKTDSQGFRWDVQSSGYISDGTNDCFDSGLMLYVNGSQFSSSQRMMTADGREFVLSQAMGSLKLTRRILVDQARAVVRYLEVFENTSNRMQNVGVEVRTQVGGSARQILTSTGAPFTGALGKKDIGIVTVSSSTSRPCVMFLLTGRRTKNKPRVSVQGNRSFHVYYGLKLKPHETQTILHYVAQRRGMGPGNTPEVFKAFYKTRLVKPEIPGHLKRTLANFHVGAGLGTVAEAGAALRPMLAVLESLDVERSQHDMLVVDEEARLTGTAGCEGLEVETKYGRVKLKLAEAALLMGAAGVGRPMRVFLRNGEILAGKFDAPGLTLRTEAGMVVELAPERINALVLHARADDGKPPEGASAFLGLHPGDRLALAVDETALIEVATAWGTAKVPLAEVLFLGYQREPQPSQRLYLTDGSRISVVLKGVQSTLRTLRFGPVEAGPYVLAALSRISPAEKDDDEDEEEEKELTSKVAHCELTGDNLLVGTIDLPELRVIAATGVTTIDPKQVRTMERRDEEEGRFPAFTFELMKGGTLSGRLETRVLPIRCGTRLLRVPTRHLLAAHVPPPQEPEEDDKK